MLTQVLFQILLAIGIVAGAVLIVDLLRLNQILRRTETISRLAEIRAKEFDAYLADLQKTTGGLIASVRSFILSFDAIRTVIERLGEAKKENKKGE